MVKAITFIEGRVHDLPLSRKVVNPTLHGDCGAATHFKWRRVSTSVVARAPVPPIEAFTMVFSLPQLPTLSVDKVATRTSTGPGTKEFKDVFSNLALSRNPFDFPLLTDKERQLMKDTMRGKIGFIEADLEVDRVLEKVFTVPSDVFEMSDENFHHYLALTGEIIFNLRNSPVSFYF